jgi:hypothetical protein
MSRLARSLILTATFGLFAAGALALIYRGGNLIHPALPSLGIWTVIQMGYELAEVEAEAADDSIATVLFLGDSTVMAYPAGHTLFEYLQAELDQTRLDGRDVRVRSVAAQGMTPGNFYLALDGIMRAQPDVVLIALNLGVIRSYLPSVLRRPELAGWMYADRLPRALFQLPLHHYGVTADQLLLHQLIVRSGRAEQWFVQRREQARVGHFRGRLQSMLAQTLPGNGRRFNQDRANEFFGLSMRGLDAEHFTMRVLSAMVEELQDAGVSVLLYVVPTNIEHLREVGIYDEEGLRTTLSRFETLANRYGAAFADYHDLLPDSAYRDAFGHLYHAEPLNGPQLLAERMAPDVSATLRRHLENR